MQDPEAHASSSKGRQRRYRSRADLFKHSSKSNEEEESESEDEASSHKEHPAVPAEDEQMVIKPTCDCARCRFWTTSVGWVTYDELHPEENIKHRAPRNRKKHPFFRIQGEKERTIKICHFDYSDLSRIELGSISRILVHSEKFDIPPQIQQVSDAPFHETVKRALYRNDYKVSLGVQAFVWRAVDRLFNVFIVDGPKRGKTLSYLPSICSFALDNLDCYEELDHFNGPLIIILCPSSQMCEEICALIRLLYASVSDKPKVSILSYPPTKTNNIDILVTLPATLVDCLKSRMFDLKRLCHLVMEESSILLNKHNQPMMNTIFKVVDEMLGNRITGHRVQLIAVSTRWSSDIEGLLKKLHSESLVCIGNNLEAALYGNTNLNIKFLKSSQKINHILKCLDGLYKVYKTVMVCSPSEICEVNKNLVRNGLETICISQDMDNVNIEAYEIEWRNARCGDYKVLLCTDFILETMWTIDDASWLVHYSFPPTWSMFSRRFCLLNTNLTSPLERAENKTRCKAYILVDESSEDQMPKIMHLLNRVQLEHSDSYKAYSESCRIRIESKKLEERIPLCGTLKLFGKCRDGLCDRRHMITLDDDVREPFLSGKVRFRILATSDVTKYSVQIYEHIHPNGNVTKFSNRDSLKPLTYDQIKDLNNSDEITLGGYYLLISYRTNEDTFDLCQVVNQQENCLEVKVLRSKSVVMVKRTKLFHLPNDLLVMDIYLANLIPPSRDETFSERSRWLSSTTLDKHNYEKVTLTGDIAVHMSNTLWLNNVVQLVKVANMELPKFDVCEVLRNLKVVVKSDMQVPLLRKFCVECGIDLPVQKVEKPKKKKVQEKSIEPQRAFLEQGTNEVIMSSAFAPDDFYVRHYKYDDLLINLQKDIQNAIERIIPKSSVKPVIGRYYLAPLPKDGEYYRAKILNVDQDKALCFYVDYGDEAIVEIETVRLLPSSLISKLPFQAILCSLHGVSASVNDRWDAEATDVLYRYSLEPDSDVYRSLYLKISDEKPSTDPRAKVKYSVLLKDGYGPGNVLINQLLIDCGLARANGNELVDFELPAAAAAAVETVDSDVENETLDFYERYASIADNFDLELYAPEGEDPRETVNRMLEAWFRSKPETRPALTDVADVKVAANVEIKTENAKETVVPVVPGEAEPEFYTPEIFWSQTDKLIKIRIKLVDVKNYKVTVGRSRFFCFSGTVGDREYKINLVLYKSVKLAEHRALGQEIQVRLVKLQEDVEWFQLATTEKRLRNIHYEIPDHQLEDKHRKFLQLDITDSEGDEVLEDDIMYCVYSDLDSEYDFDIQSDD